MFIVLYICNIWTASCISPEDSANTRSLSYLFKCAVHVCSVLIFPEFYIFRVYDYGPRSITKWLTRMACSISDSFHFVYSMASDFSSTTNITIDAAIMWSLHWLEGLAGGSSIDYYVASRNSRPYKHIMTAVSLAHCHDQKLL